jgi:hypothetical protein
VAERTVWHLDPPEVAAALGGAVKRDLGDGLWAFGRRRSAAQVVEVDPVVACANAHWLLRSMRTYDVLDSVM